MGVNLWEGNKAQSLIDAVIAQGGEITDAIKALTNTGDFSTAAGIVKTIRSGNADKVPNGTLFTEKHDVYGDIIFVTRAVNQHKVAGDSSRSAITIQPLYLLSADGGSTAATFQYDRAEAFIKVSEAIPAGTVCKFTTIAYGNWAAGTYNFTAADAIAAGSLLCISGNQGTALTSLKVVVYADNKTTTGTGNYAISSGEGSATVDLGTWGTDCNHPQRVSYGSNNAAQSNLSQWLNTDSGTKYMSEYFTAQTDWDMMDVSFTSKKGFLGGFSDEFRSYLGLCAISNVTNNVFETNGYTKGGAAYTYNGYFFLPSRKELYGTNETTGEAGETQFSYYANVGTTDADKLMYARYATSPNHYWLRTPSASYAHTVRICYVGYGGALSNTYAVYSYGVSPLAILA